MCGIVGVLSKTDDRPDPKVVRRMADAIAHRGPDDEGYFSEGPMAFGFRRLSIIDLGGGHQPLSIGDGRYTIIFNGEIFNYREIRDRLVKQHHVRFSTSSDTEVILQAYALWGERALQQLNGMFAFAIWDASEKKLFCARDRMGKKPFYFADVEGAFVFASEIKGLFKHPAVSREANPSCLGAFLTYRYVPGGETLFKGIQVLPPGHEMMVSAEHGILHSRRYWDYGFGENYATGYYDPNDIAERLEEMLSDSVKLRMISDVPFGAFLSGGIDSSLIVAMMSRLHSEPVKTFSIAFDTGFSEENFAQMVAKDFGCDHEEIRVGSDELIANIPKALHARESPISEPSDIPIYLLAEAARKKVTVVLSGEGSDEIFAGYPKYAFEAQADRYHLPHSPTLRTVANALPASMRRAQLALECLGEPDKLERYARWFGAFGAPERNALLHPDVVAAGSIHGFSAQAILNKQFHSPADEMMYLDTQHWLPANLLLRGDRMTMAHSLELRCPFLDYRLVEYAASEVPIGMKIKQFEGKWVLKRLAGKYLPDEIVNRKKWGFKVPIAEWFRGPLSGPLKDILLAPTALKRGYFMQGRLRELIDEHESGRRNHEKQLWILFQFELWHRMFIDGTLQPGDSLKLG